MKDLVQEQKDLKHKLKDVKKLESKLPSRLRESGCSNHTLEANALQIQITINKDQINFFQNPKGIINLMQEGQKANKNKTKKR